jgi:hypothetical protein
MAAQTMYLKFPSCKSKFDSIIHVSGGVAISLECRISGCMCHTRGLLSSLSVSTTSKVAIKQWRTEANKTSNPRARRRLEEYKVQKIAQADYDVINSSLALCTHTHAPSAEKEAKPSKSTTQSSSPLHTRKNIYVCARRIFPFFFAFRVQPIW